MRYFIIEQKDIQEDKGIITGSEARHVSRVLRRDVGDRLNLVEEHGCEYLAVKISKNQQDIAVK